MNNYQKRMNVAKTILYIWTKSCTFLLCSALLASSSEIDGDNSKQYNIAVIGAGIGGAVASYFIQEEFEGKASISVFDSNKRVGGRIKHFSVRDANFELGASIFWTGNQYLAELTEKMNLTKIAPGYTLDVPSSLGLWDGTAFNYMQYSEMKPMKVLRTLLAYGTEILKLRSLVNENLDKFVQIYELQKNGTAFRSADALWGAVGLGDLTEWTMRRYLVDQFDNQHPKIAHQLVYAMNKCNYNQGLEMNALAGMVSMCPMITGSLFQVREGNAALVGALLGAAGARLHLGTPAREIRRDGGGGGPGPGPARASYAIKSDNDAMFEGFDAVVLATPLTAANPAIRFIKDGKRVLINNKGRKLQTVHTTFIEGDLKPGYFGQQSSLPTNILLTESGAGEPFNSIALYQRISKGKNLYKIFSSAPLDHYDVQRLFRSPGGGGGGGGAAAPPRVVAHEKWLATPRHAPNAQGLPEMIPFPEDHIYHLNALEDAVSAMEICAISGKNVALLLRDDLLKQEV